MRNLFCFLALSVGILSPAQAIIMTYEFNGGFQNGGAVPDGDPAGLADLRNIASPITSIDDISVSLKLSGSWNGDIYATLQHGSGFAVLLNRVGGTGGNSFGFGDDGFDVTFNDLGGFSDIHGQTSGGGLLAGTFGSDGRETDPNDVVDTDPRTALLDSFVGLGVGGDWTLFVADLAGGDSYVLESWRMEITGTGAVGVPDAGLSVLVFTVALAGLLCFKLTRRKNHRGLSKVWVDSE